MQFMCNKMRKKVVCFDLDDTLYKEIGFLYSGYRVISQVIEQRTGSTGVYDQMCQLRHDGKNVFEELEKKYRGVINKAEMLTIYREHKPSISLDDGIESLLDALKQSGCIIGLITDGRSISQRNKISALGLERWIDNQNIVISEEFGSEKPNEQNYLYFEKRYPGCRYYYIGDNVEKDFIAPNKLGWETYCLKNDMRNVHYQNFNMPDIYLPNRIISLISDLILLIENE